MYIIRKAKTLVQLLPRRPRQGTVAEEVFMELASREHGKQIKKKGKKIHGEGWVGKPHNGLAIILSALHP